MQHAIRGGAEQQSETVSSVAADDHQICRLFLGNTVNLGFRAPEDQIAVIGRNTDGTGELREMRLRLRVNLLLHRRQIHRYVAAVREAQQFDHVDDVQFGFEALRERHCAIGHAMRFFSEVYR